MAMDRTSLGLERCENVHKKVETVGQECLRLYEALLSATVITHDDTEETRLATRLCLVYFLEKIQRVTRAALTLILAGQGIEAMSLIREQNHFITSLYYYQKNLDEALLFMVSERLTKLKFARDTMNFDDKAATDPHRIEQLKELERTVADAYKRYPGMRKAKGKSGTSRFPVWIDWSEPSAFDMQYDVINRLVRAEHAKRGELIDEIAFKERLGKIVKRTYFMRSTFISQSKHGTAFGLGGSFDFNEHGEIERREHQIGDPNGLAFFFISNALPPLVEYRDDMVPGAFEAEIVALGESYSVLGSELGVINEPFEI